MCARECVSRESHEAELLGHRPCNVAHAPPGAAGGGPKEAGSSAEEPQPAGETQPIGAVVGGYMNLYLSV